MKKLVITLITGIILGYLSNEYMSAKPKWDSDALLLGELDRRLDSFCVKTNPSEKHQYELAVQILESKASRSSWLDIGAVKFLANGIYRKTDEITQRTCAPDNIYQRASLAMESRVLFPPKIQEYHLKLASKISNPSNYIIKTVARVAFSPQIQLDNGKDMRPIARSILASFGTKAKEYGDISFKEMSANDPLGTGAAQIAAATRYPKALSRIQELMYEILETSEPINREERMRFYELAYAYLADKEAAEKYTAPIHDFMARDFAAWILPPKDMCRVLLKIHDMDTSVISTFDYCINGKSKES
jgi:hypothetical protein